jgi:hypothetical protein
VVTQEPTILVDEVVELEGERSQYMTPNVDMLVFETHKWK